MKHRVVLALFCILLLSGCNGIKITKPMLRMIVSGSDKVSTEPAYADSLGKRIGVPYVSEGTPAQVLDIYYADKAVRKDAVLNMNKDYMFLTGDSAGGHLALYMAEGSADTSLPIRPSVFKPRGVLLNCPAYDYASFAGGDGFTKEALAWFIGPRYEDKAYLESLSPRTFIGSYKGPLFVSTSRHDFIREQALLLKQDCDSLERKFEFLDIPSDDKKVGHVHNVVNQELPESKTVNNRMLEFMNNILK